jgi:hypothetical protein
MDFKNPRTMDFVCYKVSKFVTKMQQELAYQYSDDEKSEHYKFLQETIEQIQTKDLITDYWLGDHMDMVKLYRAWIPDFSIINPECDDPDFRRVATKAERIMDTLLHIYEEECTLNVDLYLELIECMLWLSDYRVIDLSDMARALLECEVDDEENVSMEEE